MRVIKAQTFGAYFRARLIDMRAYNFFHRSMQQVCRRMMRLCQLTILYIDSCCDCRANTEVRNSDTRVQVEAVVLHGLFDYKDFFAVYAQHAIIAYLAAAFSIEGCGVEKNSTFIAFADVLDQTTFEAESEDITLEAEAIVAHEFSCVNASFFELATQ